MEIYKIIAVLLVVFTVKLPDKWWQAVLFVLGMAILLMVCQ